MKERYRLFLRRKSVYYAFDNTTKTFESLKTKDKAKAGRDPSNPAHINAASAAFDVMCRTVVDPQFTNKLKDSWARPWFPD
jgi:hypothetical protein